jgi:putative transposase
LPIESQTVSQMVDRILAMPEGTRLYLLAPTVRGRKGEYKKELQELRKRGFQRVKINGEMHYLWRAVDQEGEVLESYVTKTRDKQAALAFMKKALKRHGSPETITTDGLRSYRAAMTTLGNKDKQEVGRWANNRVENSHLPFRRRERAMLRFRQMKTLQKFASVHANVHNHFNLDRHLTDRQTYKIARSAALAEWQNLIA